MRKRKWQIKGGKPKIKKGPRVQKSRFIFNKIFVAYHRSIDRSWRAEHEYVLFYLPFSLIGKENDI